MYQVRRVNIGTSEQLKTLAHAAGEVYTRTVVFYWRTVRHKGIWLQPKHLMRLIPSDPENMLHARISRCDRPGLLCFSQIMEKTPEERSEQQATKTTEMVFSGRV